MKYQKINQNNYELTFVDKEADPGDITEQVKHLKCIWFKSQNISERYHYSKHCNTVCACV